MDRIPQFAAFKINIPRIVHQTIEGETIIIDFDNGAYFSTDDVGAVIWEHVARNAPINVMIHALKQCYAGDYDSIKKGVEAFLVELQNESLIVPLEKISTTPQASPPSISPDLMSLPAFHVPVLNKYTDMQDLLLLDPIHEVDEQGWPVKKDTAAE